jgi:hypothetical protein
MKAADVRTAFDLVLKGLLRCMPCGCALTPTHTSRNGTERSGSSVGSTAPKHGRN